ncbi:tetratricopeptide repeat protein [Singulisphaera sp. Ch08]|uniref:Tetratricopeptide repeat protein n=1 Tax=Singulisphaera sp. Ch08 TaxID=3120278 RepID=A0AAU7CFV9_9BACT
MIDSVRRFPSASTTDPALSDLFEELAVRIQAGESLDPEELAREHPELAEALRSILPAVEILVGLGRRAADFASGPEHPAPDVNPGAEVLGDFRILREIGRGGMGVVFEAQQISLGRRVALKVLPFAAALDQRQLQRFRVEAQAAAHLHHEHIVPVFSVGCERGVHYYAMQLIEGRTLAHLIGELRRFEGPASLEARRRGRSPSPTGRLASDTLLAPECESGTGWLSSDGPPPSSDFDARPSGTPHATGASSSPLHSWTGTGTSTRGRTFIRNVAELGLQAAEALEHAHQLGVVHRDIKPANLLVDERRSLWITDFGLARLHGDNGLSLTGDLMGTFRYMSPEQVRARSMPIDHRTDIYSLGATLYELLTLRSAIPGDSQPEIIQRILQEEPIPPRQLNRAIPPDLETIVLKAMAKVPSERYVAAQELADDLRRYLEDRPIVARRPSLAHRAAKWSRRHRSIVAAAALILFLAVPALAISNLRIWWEKEAKEIALRQKDDAFRQRLTALTEARLNASRATIEAQTASAISDLLHEMLASANPDKSKGQNYTVRELLDDFSRRIDHQLERQPEVEATVRRTIGVAYRRLGLTEQAEPHLKRALELRRCAFDANPEKVAESLIDIAWNLAARGQLAPAEKSVREALLIYRDRGEPEVPMIQALWALQWLQVYQGKHAESEAAAREALAILRKNPGSTSPEIANILHTLADSKNDRYRFSEAEPLAREALTLHRRLHGANHPEMGWGWNALARALFGLGRYAEAEASFREALKIFRAQYGDRHKSVSQVLQGIASSLRAQGKNEGLETLICEMLPNQTRSVEQNPKDPAPWLHRGLAIADWEQWTRAAADCDRAFELRNALAPASLQELGDFYDRWSLQADRNNSHEEAEKAVRRAVLIFGELVGADHPPAEVRMKLGRLRELLGHLLSSSGRHHEAEETYQAALEVFEALAEQSPESLDLRRIRGLLHRRHGETLEWVDRSQDAEKAYHRALGHFENLERAAPSVPEHRQEYALALRALSELLEHGGRLPEAEAMHRRRLLILKKAVIDFPSHQELRKQLALSSAGLAAVVLRQGTERSPPEVDPVRDLLREAAQTCPDSPEARNEFAWYLVRYPGDCAELAKIGIELARKAVEKAPEAGHLWNTLGAAYYRVGKWPEALEALEKSQHLTIENHFGHNAFFLAMTHWRCGHEEQARRWHQRARNWMEKNRPRDKELSRLSGEASRLFELQAPVADPPAT